MCRHEWSSCPRMKWLNTFVCGLLLHKLVSNLASLKSLVRGATSWNGVSFYRDQRGWRIAVVSMSVTVAMMYKVSQSPPLCIMASLSWRKIRVKTLIKPCCLNHNPLPSSWPTLLQTSTIPQDSKHNLQFKRTISEFWAQRAFVFHMNSDWRMKEWSDRERPL